MIRTGKGLSLFEIGYNGRNQAGYQFCGLHHSDMKWVLDARSQADYDSWLKDQEAAQSK